MDSTYTKIYKRVCIYVHYARGTQGIIDTAMYYIKMEYERERKKRKDVIGMCGYHIHT